MSANSYNSPGSFKAALEDRLRRNFDGGIEVQRRRQLVVFTRFLARLNSAFGDAVVLKGGFALEVRLALARTTRDLDLMLLGPDAQLLERLQAAGQLDLEDFMTFEIQADKDAPEIDSAVYGGRRYRAECKLAGKVYGARFGLDVVLGGSMLGEPSPIETEAFLDFAGIAAPVARVLPVETHLAEKLHAYTLPRSVENSRIRDLPDMALIGTVKDTLQSQRFRDALRLTFESRGIHNAPTALPPPPASWTTGYARLAEAQRLPWRSIEQVTEAARAFVDPLLSNANLTTWDAAHWIWR